MSEVTPEIKPKYDLVVGFGEDRRIGLNQEKIKNNPNHLGPLSKEVALATGILVGQGDAPYAALLGYESENMRNYIRAKLLKLTKQNVDESKIYAAQATRDTQGNIDSLVNIIEEKKAKRIALVTAPAEHGQRTAELIKTAFEKRGLSVPEMELRSAEDIVSHINRHFKRAASKIHNSWAMRIERHFKEPLLHFLQTNPVGRFALRTVTRFTRSDVKENLGTSPTQATEETS